ncbi:ATP-dependent nuclease [Pokkaliibacter sp. CJK22405]|uniref:ATP-dependent nuclease n=1 Tax=Pokkaliibacter sp. CJK22405 TaxID=3384615 RepID=UPI003984E1CC
MKLSRVEIKNFRGIGEAVIDIEDFTTLVGPNNIGKSTILHAIHLVLDNKKPQPEDWPNKIASDEKMIIVCEFKDIEEWESKKPAISKLVHEGKVKVRLLAEWNEDKSNYSYYYSVFSNEYIYPWDGFKNYSEARKDDVCKEIFDDFGIKSAADYKEAIESLKDFTRGTFPEKIKENIDWHEKKFATSLQQAIPHVMYVPASFKIEDELKSTNNSPFSYLFSNKLFPLVRKDDSYNQYLEKASLLQQKLRGQSESEGFIEGLDGALRKISETLNQILDFDSKVKLSIGDIDIENLFVKAATFLIDDEIETSLNYQGSGVQRALAFAMLETNAEVESEVSGDQRTIIVLYEEPELYIHPHLMRRLKNTLGQRSKSSKWQVICSTHSPFLISLADNPKSIKLIKRDKQNARKVHQIDETIFEVSGEYDERVMLRATLDFHPTVCECIFAKRVIVVEGDTEVAVFSLLTELSARLGITDNLYKDITVISAGGKWTIPAIARILEKMDIEYLVIHDEDRKGLNDDELEKLPAIHPFNANKKILDVAGEGKVFLVKDTFEHLIWNEKEREGLKSNGKPFNSWKRIRQYIDGQINLSQESEENLKSIIDFAFVEKKL